MRDMTRDDVEEYLRFAEKAMVDARFCIRVTPEHAAELCRAWLYMDSAANEAALQRQLEGSATDNDTRTISRIMAEIAEEELASSPKD